MDLRTEIIFPCSTNWLTPVTEMKYLLSGTKEVFKYSSGLFSYTKSYSCGQSGTTATVHRYRDTFAIMEVFQIHEIIIQQALALHIQHHRKQVTASNICSVSRHFLSRSAHGGLDN